MPNRPLATRYEDDFRLLAGRWERRGVIALGLVLAAFPLLASSYWLTVALLALIAIVGSTALMILTGFTGQISLGHAAFLAIGAYTTAILGNLYALPLWLLLPAAGLAAAAVGLAIGPFALRLEGLYLAIVTIGLIFLVNHVLLSFPGVTGGAAGIAVPVRLWFGDDPAAISASSSLGGFTVTLEHRLYALFLPLALLTVLAARNLARSASGRAMMAVRDHDVAAAVLGIDPARTKITAFGLSSFFAGLAGGMFALQQQYLSVDPPFNLILSVNYIAMIVLGGMGTVFGAVAGALAFVFLTPLLEIAARHTPLLAQLSSSQQSTLLFAILVIACLVFEPLGLYGLWLRVKRYFAAWPFRY